MRPATIFSIGWGLVALAGCSSTEPPSAAPPPQTVNVGDNFFNPSGFQLGTGDRLTWQWQGGLQHNVTFDDGATGSATQSSGTFSRVFDTPGTFGYHCSIHGAMVMSGTVVVSDGGNSTSGNGGPYTR